MIDDLDALPARLRHVRFIGGGSGSGKSTIAHRLAAEYGLRLHAVEPLSAYVERTTPDDAPLLHAFVAMDMDERWLNRTPDVMRDTFHGFQGEGFWLLVEGTSWRCPRRRPFSWRGSRSCLASWRRF